MNFHVKSDLRTELHKSFASLICSEQITLFNFQDIFTPVT